MSIIKAITSAVSGTLADQWKDIITSGTFDERTVVAPGLLQQTNNGRGANTSGSHGVISNGSKILIPENTAAFIFSQAGIEDIITAPGAYEYQDGQASIFDGDGASASILEQVTDRIGFGGQASVQKNISFVNLREIRGIKFGTKGPLIYNDLYYGTDLEILAFGTFSLQIVDAEKFIRNFVPANVKFYSFDDPAARAQILSEFLQSFVYALNSLSTKYRISQLPSKTNEVVASISDADSNAGTWNERFGLRVINVGIEKIGLTQESRELVKQFSSHKMNVRAFEDVTQSSSNIAAQQKIAQGVQDHGLGNGGGALLGMNMAQAMNPMTAETAQQSSSTQALSIDEQIETLKKLKELMDIGILSQEEFDIKKKEIMGL